MVVFASSRASWLLSLAVLGLACTGTREDPSPGDAPPAYQFGPPGTGGNGSAGGSAIGGGNAAGGSAGFQFDDCACAAIAESHADSVCDACADAANTPPSTCEVQRTACEQDTDGCGLALLLLADNNCAGDPQCAADKLTGILDEASADALFGYFSCLCGQCAVCNDAGVGGGSAGGGSSVPEGACVVSPE